VPLSIDRWAVIIATAGSLFIAEELRRVIAPKLFNRGKWTPA